MSNRFALILSFESLSVDSRCLVTAYLLYHIVFRLSSTFLKFFEKVFFRKLSLPAKLFSNLHKVLVARLTSDTIFKLLCRSFDSCLMRQLDYNTTPFDKCQHLNLCFSCMTIFKRIFQIIPVDLFMYVIICPDSCLSIIQSALTTNIMIQAGSIIPDILQRYPSRLFRNRLYTKGQRLPCQEHRHIPSTNGFCRQHLRHRCAAYF